jgi:hypothetical protein
MIGQSARAVFDPRGVAGAERLPAPRIPGFQLANVIPSGSQVFQEVLAKQKSEPF